MSLHSLNYFGWMIQASYIYMEYQAVRIDTVCTLLVPRAKAPERCLYAAVVTHESVRIPFRSAWSVPSRVSLRSSESKSEGHGSSGSIAGAI